MKYTDKKLEELPFATMVIEESVKQIDKWGIQTHTLFEWLTYTTEELGELAKAISELEYRSSSPSGELRELCKKEIIKEAIQVATLALKIAEMVKEPK